jgi:hypothetical protein
MHDFSIQGIKFYKSNLFFYIGDSKKNEFGS